MLTLRFKLLKNIAVSCFFIPNSSHIVELQKLLFVMNILYMTKNRCSPNCLRIQLIMRAELCSQKQLTSTNAHPKMISIHFAKCVSGLFFFQCGHRFSQHVPILNSDRGTLTMMMMECFFYFPEDKDFTPFCTIVHFDKTQSSDNNTKTDKFMTIWFIRFLIFLRTKILCHFGQWYILARPTPV